MSKHLINIIEKESSILEELLTVSKDLKEALIKYNHTDIMNLTHKQEELSNVLNQMEAQRIEFISNWLNIEKAEASRMTFSQVLEILKNSNNGISNIYKFMISKVKELNSVNSLNRVLANRARHSMHEILSMFSDGTNYVCNVKV